MQRQRFDRCHSGLAAAGQQSLDLRSVVAMHDPQGRPLSYDCSWRFLGSSVEIGKSDSVEFAGNRRLKFQLRRDITPKRFLYFTRCSRLRPGLSGVARVVAQCRH